MTQAVYKYLRRLVADDIRVLEVVVEEVDKLGDECPKTARELKVALAALDELGGRD